MEEGEKVGTLALALCVMTAVSDEHRDPLELKLQRIYQTLRVVHLRSEESSKKSEGYGVRNRCF